MASHGRPDQLAGRVYHYFGDEDGLYATVLEHVLGELRREELKLEVEHVEPLEGMLTLFSFVHSHFGAHPELISLLSGQDLLRARFLERPVKAPIRAGKRRSSPTRATCSRASSCCTRARAPPE